MNPRTATTSSATISIARNTPVTTVLTRMFSSPTIVDRPTTPIATGTCGSPGSTVDNTALTPSPSTGGKSRLLNTLTPSIMNPVNGPRVRATWTYSPPAIGQAEDNSA